MKVTEDQLKLAYEQNLGNFILVNDHEFPISFEDRAKQLMRGQIRFEALKHEAVTIAEKFDSLDIDYRFLKGLAISVTYPNPFTRNMSDLDILVKPEAFEKAAAGLKQIGYHQEHYDPFSKDISFFKIGSHTIELHRALFNSTDDFYMDYQDLLDLLWKEVSYIEISNYPIKVPDPQEHLKFVIMHFFKHLFYNFKVRFLLDVVYFSNFHQIDWKEIESYFVNGSLEKFIRILENVLIYYFNGNGYGREPLNEIEIHDVQMAGEYLLFDELYGNGENSEQINRLMFYQRACQKSPYKMVRMALFPDRFSLGSRYTYAKSMPVLLPVAWIHRFVSFVFSNRSVEKKMFFLSKEKDVIQKKEAALELLGYYRK